MEIQFDYSRKDEFLSSDPNINCDIFEFTEDEGRIQ